MISYDVVHQLLLYVMIVATKSMICSNNVVYKNIIYMCNKLLVDFFSTLSHQNILLTSQQASYLLWTSTQVVMFRSLSLPNAFAQHRSSYYCTPAISSIQRVLWHIAFFNTINCQGLQFTQNFDIARICKMFYYLLTCNVHFTHIHM